MFKRVFETQQICIVSCPAILFVPHIYKEHTICIPTWYKPRASLLTAMPMSPHKVRLKEAACEITCGNCVAPGDKLSPWQACVERIGVHRHNHHCLSFHVTFLSTKLQWHLCSFSSDVYLCCVVVFRDAQFRYCRRILCHLVDSLGVIQTADQIANPLCQRQRCVAERERVVGRVTRIQCVRRTCCVGSREYDSSNWRVPGVHAHL